MAESVFSVNLGPKKVWAMDLWSTVRDNSFLMRAAGSDINSIFYNVTELTPTEKGDRAVYTLVPDTVGDGIMGDVDVDGNEEALSAEEQEITIDQITNAHKSGGRMEQQKTIIRFRETARDKLGYWLADRLDQLAFLTLSGVTYNLRTNGALRPTNPTGFNLTELAFASDVAAPSANRHYRWDSASSSLVPGDTTAVTAADTLTYNALVLAKAKAVDKYIRPIRGEFGKARYAVFLHPMALARLKLDPDFQRAVITAQPRSDANSFWSGAIETIDGLAIFEYRHVFNTLGATAGTSANAGAPGFKWGANADVDGCRVLICGGQSLAFATLGEPVWDEYLYPYNRKLGVAISQIIGFRKPQFTSLVDGTVEDYGVLALDVAI